MSSQLELVIFDADGVLFESAESNVAYYNAIFQILGEPRLSPDEERAALFMAASQVFELRANGDQTKLARMREIGAGLDFAPFFKLLKLPFPLRPFILGLKRHYRLGLATNRSATVPALIEYLELADLFDAVARKQVTMADFIAKLEAIPPEQGIEPFPSAVTVAGGIQFITKKVINDDGLASAIQ